MRAGSSVLATTLLVALVVAGCGGSGGLDGNAAARNLGGDSAKVGEPTDYTAFVFNNSGRPVTLRTATLLSLPGFKAPQLAHLAVEAGLQIAFADHGWPPGPGYDLRPFSGYVVPSGRRVQIMYSVVAAAAGDYVAKGIRVTTREGLSVDSLSASLTCVIAHGDPPPCPQSLFDRVLAAVADEPKN